MNLLFKLAIVSLLVMTLLSMIFYSISKKTMWDNLIYSTFECGYTSYNYSRNSFSIHYLVIGLIFLFFDLELSILLPFLSESWNNLKMYSMMFIIIFILLISLFIEWKIKKIEWKF